MTDEGRKASKECGRTPAKKTSMGSLISWNVSKALENNPNLDLKAAMKLAQERLEESSSDVNSMLSRYPHERHLACALLAWQNLGHRGADSLYSFVTSNRSELSCTEKVVSKRRSGARDCPTFFCGPPLCSIMARSNEMCGSTGSEAPVGPVVRLPVESIVMPVHQCHYDNKPPGRQQARKNAKDVKSKIDAACCLSTECADRLSAMDAAVTELRTRANRLAKREAQRVELLERAEQAWRDLESGYQRRLRAAEEKEHEIANQVSRHALTRRIAGVLLGAAVIEMRMRANRLAKREAQRVELLERAKQAWRDLESGYQRRLRAAEEKEHEIANQVSRLALTRRIAGVLLGAAVIEMRTRANRLAKREAQRVELLERAEQAWRDLESGYQRRLRAAEEKEHEIANQTAKLMLLRNEQKSQTSALMADLKAKTDAAEREREALGTVEREMCARACERAKQAEQAAKSDAALAEHLCKASQLDRELLFKEEQSRRKQLSMEGAADSAQALVHEAERAMREELAALRDQIGRVGIECNYEDATTAELRHELDDLRQERNGLAEDLEGCQLLCDSNMKAQHDELVKKTQQLAELHQKVMECRCKLPVDAPVTVKRTPSLAALCRCTPEDQFGDSCSCTSLRSQLLSNLLADLFGGLQSELGDTGAQMPCQLLKCLEDKHNWDRCTPVKSNLRDYFSKLLLGELDIAIATSIEKYHATWVGASCADKPLKADMPCESMHSEDWQARALECKAQKMATKLAEQLFKEKAKELAQQAQDELAKQGKPPCECHPSSCCPSPPKFQSTQCNCSSGRGCAPRGAAVYQCLVKPPLIGGMDSTSNELTAPKYLRSTLQDVSQLRTQIEELKKSIIKREDLTTMEANIAKMVRFASIISPAPSLLEIREPTEIKKKDPKCPRSITTVASTKNSGVSKLINRKKPLEPAINASKPFKPAFGQFRTKASGKDFKRPTQQFAVNLCLCDATNRVSAQSKVLPQSKNGSKSTCKQSISKDNESLVSNKSQAQHIESVTPEISHYDKASTLSTCTEKCICFHKKPSDISINKLLETLTKWRDDLVDIPEKQNIDKRPENPKSIFRISQQMVSNIQEKPHIKIMDDKSIGNLELFKVSSQNVKALCDSETLTDTVDQVETSAKTKIVVDLPTLTDSEYMGAINLEKSTEHSCECENNENDGDMCYKNADKFTFKCINSKKCMCKSCISTPTNHKQGTDTETVLVQNSVPIASKPIHDCYTYSGTEIPLKANQNKEVGDVAVSVKTSLKSVNCSALFQNNYENCIKCLGVTLSNVTSQSFLQNLNLKQSTSTHTINLRDTGNIDILYNSVQETNVNNKTNERCETLVRTTCLGVDKFIEVQNFKNDIQPLDESCICCPTFSASASTDLEVNAFQLLEEHLRGKLNEFKHSVCKSSCILHDDAEKLFADILQRVKQLIFDSTNTVTCECKGNSQVKGSWERAYSLLYEYLRIKIERVKCQCQSKNKMKDDLVLPNVLNDINYLIENDFKRLQEICRCKKYKPSNKTESNTNEEIRDSLDIVIDDSNMKEVPNIIELKRAPTSKILDNGKDQQEGIIESQNPSLFMRGVSAQVSPYHCMETKSCDAMEKNNNYTDVQTMAENIKIITIDGFNNTKSLSECCSKTKSATKGLNPSFVELTEKNYNSLDGLNFLQKGTDLFSSCKPFNLSNKESAIQMEIERIFGEQQNIEKMNKKAQNASLSYIGYTMNCCCDTGLGCVCTKSTVRAQNDRLKIKDIWKTYTKNNTVYQNVSYMLDNTPDKLPKTVNYVEIREGFYPNLAHEYESILGAKSNVCESEINTNSEKDIVLKESKESVSMSHVTTNTIGQKRKPKSDSSLECSDCFTAPSKPKSERFSVINQNKKIELFYPEESFLRFEDSDTALNDNTVNTSGSSVANCNCKMVPICHVKMLVENIEDKLANAQCTCDSLSSKVCPVHSQREIY